VYQLLEIEARWLLSGENGALKVRHQERQPHEAAEMAEIR
jgi:hypothetical protein